ncbi:unnamed protein product [Strongylus vulgaris]|uniref:Uncharacterized protein n=1 Tax=Strongylus vulgaris TaxID=40348 RepID=A0A3P7J367_STRVU|nr:unnamed protein product [Strongylus vulgaris]
MRFIPNTVTRVPDVHTTCNRRLRTEANRRIFGTLNLLSYLMETRPPCRGGTVNDYEVRCMSAKIIGMHKVEDEPPKEY